VGVPFRNRRRLRSVTGGSEAPMSASKLQSVPAMLESDATREQLLVEHLPEVQYIARRIHNRLPPQVPLEDLVHAGIIGLIDAVRKYDPSKNVRLRHYAKFRIRGAILDSLRSGDWSPRALRKQGRSVELARRNCKAILGREPTEIEVADELHMNLADYQRLLGDLRGLDLGSLQRTSGESEDSEELWQMRTDVEAETPFLICLRGEMTGLLARCLAELPDRERRVLMMYHYEELTMKQVGSAMGIGESRVSQIHTEALTRLRVRVKQELEAPAAASGAACASS
jgi:RNA polymerase sigma factor for flagellar operon FliA